MIYDPKEPDAIEPPPEGWCNELFEGKTTETFGVAPIVRWYYCRLPKGHDPNVQHSCYASRIGK